jgi:hypothetical protein
VQQDPVQQSCLRSHVLGEQLVESILFSLLGGCCTDRSVSSVVCQIGEVSTFTAWHFGSLQV